jgi:hypothetical protein
MHLRCASQYIMLFGGTKSIHRVLLSIYRVHLSMYRVLWSICRVYLSMYRVLLLSKSTYRVLLLWKHKVNTQGTFENQVSSPHQQRPWLRRWRRRRSRRWRQGRRKCWSRNGLLPQRKKISKVSVLVHLPCKSQ